MFALLVIFFATAALESVLLRLNYNKGDNYITYVELEQSMGTQGGMSSQVKGKLQVLIDKTVDELTTANLSVSHKLKLLELALNYTLPKLAHTYKEVDNNQKSFRVEYVGKTVDYNVEKN